MRLRLRRDDGVELEASSSASSTRGRVTASRSRSTRRGLRGACLAAGRSRGPRGADNPVALPTRPDIDRTIDRLDDALRRAGARPLRSGAGIPTRSIWIAAAIHPRSLPTWHDSGVVSI